MEPRLFDLDFQLLADSVLTIIAVFVLFIALSYLLFNPARKFMQKRSNKIAGELKLGKDDEEDAFALKAEYKAKLADVEKRTDEILTRHAKRLWQMRRPLWKRHGLRRLRSSPAHGWRQKLEKQKAADGIRREMVGLAMEAAGKFVRVSMDEKRRMR